MPLLQEIMSKVPFENILILDSNKNENKHFTVSYLLSAFSPTQNSTPVLGGNKGFVDHSNIQR